MNETTTIQISLANRALLDELGEKMRQDHPTILDHQPTYNVIVGYAVQQALDARGGGS
jgi:hypothetical protein